MTFNSQHPSRPQWNHLSTTSYSPMVKEPTSLFDPKFQPTLSIEISLWHWGAAARPLSLLCWKTNGSLFPSDVSSDPSAILEVGISRSQPRFRFWFRFNVSDRNVDGHYFSFCVESFYFEKSLNLKKHCVVKTFHRLMAFLLFDFVSQPRAVL